VNAALTNIAAFRRVIEQVYGLGDPSVVDELFAETFVEHEAGIESKTRGGVKADIQFLRRVSPDMVVTIEGIAADGDKVWARLRARGTHSGPGLGPPTGHRFDITVMDLARFENGRLVEHWGVPDRFAQARQPGLIPPTNTSM
jgi:predicted ester cyclase